ncbi:MAG TPA: hypothetical protein GXZ58_10835 [Bacilli bacterium]|uniref:Uncharacterized protein n=1 Tax=Amphibacillus indicireducens TaxID=1076330 RepID=A0ABP7V2E6_9BACI|nr:hypothetical protein [Bacilli bacterium]
MTVLYSGDEALESVAVDPDLEIVCDVDKMELVFEQFQDRVAEAIVAGIEEYLFDS